MGWEIAGPAGRPGSSLEFPTSVRSWEDFGRTSAPAAEGWPCLSKPCQPKPCPSPPFRAAGVSGFSSDLRGTQAKPTRMEAASVMETCGGKSATGPDSLANSFFQHQSNYFGQPRKSEDRRCVAGDNRRDTGPADRSMRKCRHNLFKRYNAPEFWSGTWKLRLPVLLVKS